MAVPVVAALPGPAAGAGTDLALAAHYRLAPATATLGLVRAMDGWATLDPLWEVPPLMRRAALAHGGFAAAVRSG
jgi:enoyl-CoA hydratase/carnithine racemase